MNEPSILDYLKYKLGMIDSLELPNEDDVDAIEEVPIIEEEPENVQTLERSNVETLSFPWLSLVGVIVALIGQGIFDRAKNMASVGVFFYLIAFGVLFFAYKKGEWILPNLRPDETSNGFDQGVQPLLFFIGSFLAVFAFIAFGSFPGTNFQDNQFTVLNTSLWLISLSLLVKSFWQPQPKTNVSRNTHHSSLITRHSLLLLLATAIILFFRLYQTASVPAEPFSDHAEKILDVFDVSQGQLHIFFPRNTGRELLQMYWTVLIAKVFGTGFSFLSLKLGTALLGLLTLPYVYLLGVEVANKRVGLLAFFLMGISYWHNVISRVGLRFPLYPLFVAPTLFYLLRGIRKQSRNDFILAGLFLGLGSHGYSPFRIMPLVVVAAVGLYLLHKNSTGIRQQALMQLVILAFMSLIVFLPLGRYALSNPEGFAYRAVSRLDNENGSAFGIFVDNVIDGLKMFNWDDGEIWVHSVPGRPALDVVSGALFLIGILFLILRYARTKHWLDLFLVLSIPLLSLPSTLSVAFPAENPALNRAGGAAVVVFVVVALAFDGLLTSLGASAKRGSKSAWVVAGILILFSLGQNYNLVFDQYANYFKVASWNSSEMGQVIAEFEAAHGQTDTVWIVPFPYWVDTRLPGVWAGIPNRDFALWQENLAESLNYSSPKLFLLKPEDEVSLTELQTLYPNGILTRYNAEIVGHDFMIFNVP